MPKNTDVQMLMLQLSSRTGTYDDVDDVTTLSALDAVNVDVDDDVVSSRTNIFLVVPSRTDIFLVVSSRTDLHGDIVVAVGPRRS